GRDPADGRASWSAARFPASVPDRSGVYAATTCCKNRRIGKWFGQGSQLSRQRAIWALQKHRGGSAFRNRPVAEARPTTEALYLRRLFTARSHNWLGSRSPSFASPMMSFATVDAIVPVWSTM